MRNILTRSNCRVFVDLAGHRRLGHIVKVNHHTTWVKVMNGAKTYDIVKRHNKKHHVNNPKLIPKERTHEIIYSTTENQITVN
jgi:hypothetical protein